jgi:hypothetical protein
MSKPQSAERLAKEYLYNLQNQAQESGFKPAEKWTLCLMTAKEKAAISKNYHAVVSMKVDPDLLLIILAEVQTKLRYDGPLPEPMEVKLNGWEYIVAYNAERERR